MRMLALVGLAAFAWAQSAQAAPQAQLVTEIRRGFTAAGHRTSDAPALRSEAAPTPGFALGAALGAWINAAETLDYDLKTPSGDGDDSETIHLDCYDERLMLEHLEQRRAAAGLSPAEVLAAGGADAHLLAAWLKRQQAPVTGCH
jgi:hypothetical protein